jgi:hypothetical protein
MRFKGRYQSEGAEAASKSMNKWAWNCTAWGLKIASLAMTGLSWAGWLGPFPVGAIVAAVPLVVHKLADRNIDGRFTAQYTNLLRDTIDNTTTPEALFAKALAVSFAFKRLSTQVRYLEPGVFRTDGADPFKMTVEPAIKAIRLALEYHHELGLASSTDVKSLRSQYDDHLKSIDGMVATVDDNNHPVQERKLALIQREWMFWYHPTGKIPTIAAGISALLNLLR